MLSSHVCIAVDANSSYLSNHAQSMRRRERDADSLHRVSRQAVQAQVVAALVIRDAVGDAINRPQAAVKPGPWPGRRAAGEALSRGLASWPHLEPSRGHGRTFTSPHVGSVYLYLYSGGLRQVYLYLRPHTPALPLPAHPALRGPNAFFAFWRGGEADLWCLETGLLGALGRVPGGTDKTETQKRSAVRFSSPAP